MYDECMWWDAAVKCDKGITSRERMNIMNKQKYVWDMDPLVSGTLIHFKPTYAYKTSLIRRSQVALAFADSRRRDLPTLNQHVYMPR